MDILVKHSLLDPPSPADYGAQYDHAFTVLTRAGYDAVEMTETAERFYSSLGLAELPDTFWERSLLTRPQDRDVVCHASAWNLDSENDLRIKQCIQINLEHFQTVHHELGHNYYQRAYNKQPYLYLDSATYNGAAVGNAAQPIMSSEQPGEFAVADQTALARPPMAAPYAPKCLAVATSEPGRSVLPPWKPLTAATTGFSSLRTPAMIGW